MGHEVNSLTSCVTRVRNLSSTCPANMRLSCRNPDGVGSGIIIVCTGSMYTLERVQITQARTQDVHCGDLCVSVYDAERGTLGYQIEICHFV